MVWLPPSGYTPFIDDPLANLRYMTLPVLTLATGEAAYILRTTRGAMEETLGAPFVTFLRAQGASQRSIVFRHALRNASVPIVTVVGIQFGVLLGGAIVVETLFALPGVGRLVVTAINQRNYTVVQGGVLVIATLFILVNLVTDLLYGWLDPRLGGGTATGERRRRRAAARAATCRGRAAAGAAILAALVLIALLAPLLAPHDPEAIDPARVLAGPDASHPFGSDALGRDVLSRVLFAFRVSLAVAVGSVLVAWRSASRSAFSPGTTAGSSTRC